MVSVLSVYLSQKPSEVGVRANSKDCLWELINQFGCCESQLMSPFLLRHHQDPHRWPWGTDRPTRPAWGQSPRQKGKFVQEELWPTGTSLCCLPTNKLDLHLDLCWEKPHINCEVTVIPHATNCHCSAKWWLLSILINLHLFVWEGCLFVCCLVGCFFCFGFLVIVAGFLFNVLAWLQEA